MSFRFFSLALIAVVASVVASTPLPGQPRLITRKAKGYVVGDRIDPDTRVIDSNGTEVRLLDLARDDTQLLVLIVFGGGTREVPAGRFRGHLWCQDSFDDLGVQRAFYRSLSERPVVFIPVAVPPVYDPEKYGFPPDVFLGQAEDSTEYRLAVQDFIRATERERESGVLPFEQIYYDPRFRLAHSSTEEAGGPEGIPAAAWQGRFRWHQDPRKYGTPIIWLLDANGLVLRDPFIGNDYDSAPPQINYGFSDLKAAAEEELEP